jgi:Flp pilus assembly protein TadG
MNHLVNQAVTVLHARWHAARADDDGATAIEWAVFALLALAVAGLVATAITLAVQNRLPGIQ